MKKLSRPIQKIPTVRPGLGVKTIPEMIETTVDKYGDNTAYLIPRNKSIYRLSYGLVLKYIKRISRYLKELRLDRGDHIAILGENRPEWAISYLSSAWIGAIAIPLDAKAPLGTHKFILGFSSVKAIFVSGSYLSDIQSIKNELNELKHVIVMENFDEIYNKYSDGVEMDSVSLDHLLEILFTSGTTGISKGVMLTHRNVMSNVDDIYQVMECSPDDRALSVLPIHHAYECTAGMLTLFYNGSSVFYSRGLKPNELVEDLQRAQPTVWLNVPLILEKLYLKILRELSNQNEIKRFLTNLLPKKLIGSKIKQRMGLNRIRLIVSGGAALPDWVSRGLEGFGFPIIQGYGLSEAAPLVTVNPLSKPKNESIGMVIPSDDVETRDIDSEGNGEIIVRGPNIMKGYYKNESATKDALTSDGWLMTGDIGYFDEEGYLYITGRKKFVIVTKGGKNIFPEEIEQKLVKSNYIEEALIFSPDDENVQAIIYPNLDEVASKLQAMSKEITDDSIWGLIRLEIKEVNQTLEAYKKIRHFAIKHGEFPKTTTQKIKRHLFKAINLTPGTKVLRD